jgi:hypothetical protein
MKKDHPRAGERLDSTIWMYMRYALTKFLLSHGGQNHNHHCTIFSGIEGEKGHVDSARKCSESPSTSSYEVAAKTTYEEGPIIEMKEKLGEKRNIPKIQSEH